MKLLIKITKEVLEATKMCGINNSDIISSCAISYACRKLFPKCFTNGGIIGIVGKNNKLQDITIIATLSKEAMQFICLFDVNTPEDRVKMKPFEFEIELTKEALDLITINEITEVLKESTTLEVV